MQSYSWLLFRSDAIAGVTVAMVAIPLSLAIAIASGADPGKGLITAVVGGFFVSLLGGSRVQIGGPTGAFIVVVFGVIAEHGYDGLVLATLMAGIILLIAGFFRLGRLIAYVPEAVVNGFTIGIGIIIATSQLRDFLGLTLDEVPADFVHKIPALWLARDTMNVSAFLIGMATLLLIIWFRRIAPKLPGLIVAVGLASAIVAVAALPVDTIASRFGTLPDQLPWPTLPTITLLKLQELLPSAIIIAFLAGVESLLSAMVADRMIEGHHRPNAELLAQGTANLASSLFGGMPATGAIARTATNVNAGGRTPVAGLVHALTVLLAMIFFSSAAGYLAMPALAALLLITAWRMSEPHKWREYLSAPLTDRMLLLITLTLTVLVDLTVAIGVGVSIGMALQLRRQKQPPRDWNVPKR
jgi:SulP family sulfate permease